MSEAFDAEAPDLAVKIVRRMGTSVDTQTGD